MTTTSLATPLFTKVEPCFAAYVLHALALGGVILAIGIIAGQPFWPIVSRRLSLPGAMALAAFVQLTGKWPSSTNSRPARDWAGQGPLERPERARNQGGSRRLQGGGNAPD